MNFRFATTADVDVLTGMNQQFIRDEGHRNRMNLAQLTDRMSDWLRGEYRAVVFEESESAIGYAVFRPESDHVYLRQFYVIAEARRNGVGRAALAWLWKNAWAEAARLRIDVLIDNAAGQAFWRSVGFEDYCLTMEALPPVRPSDGS